MSARVDAIHPKAIIGHYARFEFSDDRAVVLELYKGQCGIAPPPFHRPPPSSDRQALQNSMWRASPAELGLASKLAADTPFRGQALCERLLGRARPSIAQIAPPPNSHLQFVSNKPFLRANAFVNGHSSPHRIVSGSRLASVCSPPLIVSFSTTYWIFPHTTPPISHLFSLIHLYYSWKRSKGVLAGAFFRLECGVERFGSWVTGRVVPRPVPFESALAILRVVGEIWHLPLYEDIVRDIGQLGEAMGVAESPMAQNNDIGSLIPERKIGSHPVFVAEIEQFDLYDLFPFLCRYVALPEPEFCSHSSTASTRAGLFRPSTHTGADPGRHRSSCLKNQKFKLDFGFTGQDAPVGGAWTERACGINVQFRFGKPKPLPSILHNKLTWFLGDIPLLTRMLKERGANTYAFEETAMRHGPVSQVVVGPGAGWASRLLGFGQAIVVLSDSQEIQDVLVNHAHEFDRSKSISFLFSGTIPEGMVVLPTNDKLKHHKRYLQMTMTAPYLARMTPGLVELMQELVDLWTVAAKRLPSSPDVAIDAMDDIRLASVDVIAAIRLRWLLQERQDLARLPRGHTRRGPVRSPRGSEARDGPAGPAGPAGRDHGGDHWSRAIDSIHGNMRTRLNATRTEYAEAAKDGGKALSEYFSMLQINSSNSSSSASGTAPAPLARGSTPVSCASGHTAVAATLVAGRPSPPTPKFSPIASFVSPQAHTPRGRRVSARGAQDGNRSRSPSPARRRDSDEKVADWSYAPAARAGTSERQVEQ
ncbi:hypothetical protein B0H14DRAFT_3156389 [Mycena olivaceomarginata]|nr:hypothetical protein B0H14DRAFT_3156389 [Mycena olivaceomarginata]